MSPTCRSCTWGRARCRPASSRRYRCSCPRHSQRHEYRYRPLPSLSGAPSPRPRALARPCARRCRRRVVLLQKPRLSFLRTRPRRNRNRCGPRRRHWRCRGRLADGRRPRLRSPPYLRRSGAGTGGSGGPRRAGEAPRGAARTAPCTRGKAAGPVGPGWGRGGP